MTLGRGRLHDVGAVLPRPPLDAVGIDSEHAQLGTEPATRPLVSGPYQGCLSYV